MSVIFGIIDKNEILLGRDKRGSLYDGSFQNDETQKVFAINSHLAIATAGNEAISTAIRIDTTKSNKVEDLTVDDEIEVIQAFYQRVESINASSVAALPFVFIVAGTGINGEPKMVSGVHNPDGILELKECKMALFPPNGTSKELCNECFAESYYNYRSEFVERTVREISKISEVVSATGNKWV